MKISARNQLKGKVVSVEPGAVNGIVVLELADGTRITSSITNASIENLGLEPGKEAIAVIKASDVMMAVD